MPNYPPPMTYAPPASSSSSSSSKIALFVIGSIVVGSMAVYYLFFSEPTAPTTPAPAAAAPSAAMVEAEIRALSGADSQSVSPSCSAPKYPAFTEVKYGAGESWLTDVAPFNAFCKGKSTCTWSDYVAVSGGKDPAPNVLKTFAGKYKCVA